MAPKKKEKNDDVPPPAAAATTRLTRSATRRANSDPPATDPPPLKPKKLKTSAKQADEPHLPPPAATVDGHGSKSIVIEHCKQCNAFKTRAIQVKNGLEKGVAGVKVTVNPEKPRRGCFEVREEDGEIFISLKDMKRPFKPMKDLDMDKVISDIVEKIK